MASNEQGIANGEGLIGEDATAIGGAHAINLQEGAGLIGGGQPTTNEVGGATAEQGTHEQQPGPGAEYADIVEQLHSSVLFSLAGSIVMQGYWQNGKMHFQNIEVQWEKNEVRWQDSDGKWQVKQLH
jgi:hypothetical protein